MGRQYGEMTTTTNLATSTNPPESTDTADSFDPRPLIGQAIATGAGVIAGVSSDQFRNPTPCPEMDVRTIIGHQVFVLERIAVIGNGADPFAVAEFDMSDDEWAAAWAAAGEKVAEAWSDDATLERPTALPWIQGSGSEVLTSYLSELTVHMWDIAVATGQQPEWDDAVVNAALEARKILPEDNRREFFEAVSESMGLHEVAMPFAEVVPVPADAPAIDRLVAWNGRDPRWSDRA